MRPCPSPIVKKKKQDGLEVGSAPQSDGNHIARKPALKRASQRCLRLCQAFAVIAHIGPRARELLGREWPVKVVLAEVALMNRGIASAHKTAIARGTVILLGLTI